MRIGLSLVLFVFLCLGVLPAHGNTIGSLTFSLDSPAVGSGYPGNSLPDPPCLQPNCVLFSGTFADTDTDPGSPDIYLYDLYVVFSSDVGSGALAADYSFESVPATLTVNPQENPEFTNSYSGPVFGIDIFGPLAPGAYTGAVYVDAAGGAGDPEYNGFTVSESFSVVVTPEPAAASLLLAGLVPLWVWPGVRRKWHSSEVSR